MKTNEYFDKINQSSCHNLCTYLPPPPRLGALLGLGLKICVKYKTPSKDSLKNAMDRMQRDVRLKYSFAGESINKDYNKKLYIKPNWEPPQANADIENRLEKFQKELTSTRKDIIINT